MEDNTILVTKSSLPNLEEYIEEIRDIWTSHWLTNMGEKHRTLQSMLQNYLQVDNVDLLTNGHMALELSIQALNLQGEIITTPFTFASTTHAIVRNGLTPVFCDINPDDFTIDVDKIEALITDKTSAILPVHVYGNVCDVDKIQDIASKYGLKVIYDAAHAFGVKYKNKGIGTFGDVSCFSFHATKVFNTIEGGAVCFGDRNKDFGLNIYRLKNFGIRGPEIVDSVGANAKMNEFCAAMGICNLKRINICFKRRKQLVDEYRKCLSNIDGMNLNKIQGDVEQNYAYFPIVIDEKQFGATRNEVLAKLAEHNIFARKYFYPLTNTFDAFHGQFNVDKTPVALHISKRVLTLPLYEELCISDVYRISDIVLSCKK
ncbi:MAG: DegT/DnrJ/EryC1/StrS family aminotransferase [Phascolarctobacterium sp.]|uniref:DegT/DnrJ/EryC1/StrS family aminotransferase n=1 Tax=Phascolarctobacterium sp. TaxID=2049039 RepID=UPI0026DB9343|nr:DegT/DnrJ/EryC1/StrS family aminotransferase [Phascolarctobacterium sp.]MDO4922251.1 DegT/DnrJ/EryC1/StrS family aminotransferase [Phascolarctobacterium sp.]